METFAEVWKLICNYCQTQITDVAYKLWFSRIVPVTLDFDHTKAIIMAPNELHRQTLNRCYKDLLINAFSEIFGVVFDVYISIPSENDKNKKPHQSLAIDSKYEFTFFSFIVGTSNKFAHAAAMAVAANPAGAYNPLFIYGNSGLGKTHLLHAICNDIKQNKPNITALYIKGDDFTNELIDSIRKNSMSVFHEKYRQADILLVDDIQFIAGKDATQEEFFHTFNALFETKKQIVLSSDRPPKEIQTLEDRLRTRFEWGLIADVQPPDFETRIAILKRRAEILDFVLPNDVCEYIAKKLKDNIRQLEGAVKKLKAYCLFGGEALGIQTARQAISDILNLDMPAPVTIEKIIEEVAKTFNVSPEDIRSAKRLGTVSSARQIAMYTVREITQMSLVSIGEAFGGRDHSTIIYAINQVEKLIKTDRKTKALVEDIIRNVRTFVK
jgi:chromosomal replication initiator protein